VHAAQEVYVRHMAEPSTDAIVDVALKVWNYKMGEQVSLLVHLGDELGLYRALQGAGPVTSEELADRTGLSERLVREWLRANAAAELLVSDADAVRFELTDAAASVLADEDGSEWFAAGAFSAPFAPEVVRGMANAFRTGVGLPYDAFGAAGAHSTARSLGPWVRAALVPRLLPMLDGVVDKLRAGARVADVGCGGGVALEALAKAFPHSRFVGFDPSHHACHDARLRVHGLDNVQIHEMAADELPQKALFDLVLTFDCLHDMPRPHDAARSIRGAIDPSGTWLVKEIRSTGSYATDRSNPLLALMYGMSVTTCLQSSLSEPGAEGFGTLGLPPAKVEAMATEAGFSTVTQHDIGEPPNLYYEIRV
jgi:2-polyprenyl-3-methyl-5-hydroxy-6-metoxy-1,4-benzoquinol methylase